MSAPDDEVSHRRADRAVSVDASAFRDAEGSITRVGGEIQIERSPHVDSVSPRKYEEDNDENVKIEDVLCLVVNVRRYLYDGGESSLWPHIYKISMTRTS